MRATDATVALAERISGTEENFVKLMNEKVKKLGLKNTYFKNSTGLDEDGHYSTAYDMAIIAKELIKHEEIFRFSSVYEDYLRKETKNKFWLVNTNKLVRFYEGTDGLKTGFTDKAKYCIAATSKRNNMRLIAIVLGENNGTTRNNETMELLNYGFNIYRIETLKKKDEVLKTIEIDNKKIFVYPKNDITILKKKMNDEQKCNFDTKINEIKLPLKKNQTIGKITLKCNNKVVEEIDVIVKEKVKKTNFINNFINKIKNIIIGIS